MEIISENFIKGEIAQAKVEIRALEKGYIVSRPMIEGTRYDMIIDNGEKLSKIQIKYAGGKHSVSKGSAVVDFRKTSNNGKQNNGYFKNEVDAIIVYLPQVDKICYFPIEMLEGKTSLTIRYENSKNNQSKNIILVEDYKW